MINWRIVECAVTESTNDDVKRAAEADEKAGYGVSALRQTKGRGRHGRTWQSPSGNLYCSVLLRPLQPRQSFGIFSYIMALAVADLVGEVLPSASIALKWPNDVLINDKKVSGILLEAGEDWLVVGVGLNLTTHPTETLYPTTSLSLEGLERPNLQDIRTLLLDYLDRWVQIFDEQGAKPILTAWCARAKKGRMTLKRPTGEVSGEFLDLEPSGALRLKCEDGRVLTVDSGDVFFS